MTGASTCSLIVHMAVWIDGRHRLLAQGDRPKRRDDLVEIIAASVLYRLPQVRPDDAIEVAEIVLNALRDNNLRIVWKPRPPPPSRPQYIPPKGKNAHLMRREARRAAGLASSEKPPPERPLPRMGESIAQAEERLRREAETRQPDPEADGSESA